jgi:glutamine cyclotransferase
MKADKRIIIALVIVLAAAFYVIQQDKPRMESAYTYQVIYKYPHDPDAFTQGLVYHDGVFYEGTGLYDESTLRIVDPDTGEPTKMINLDPAYFAEGVTILDDRVYQLTWRQHIGFIYTLELELVGNFTVEGEGWGLATDGEYLILSDGTSTISYLDSETLTPVDTITVTFEDSEIDQINELEYIDGLIYANIWQTDMIAVIEPETGEIISWIDLTGLSDELDNQIGINVLNGIAYDQANDRLFVTGKLWPNIFEIKLVPK